MLGRGWRAKLLTFNATGRYQTAISCWLWLFRIVGWQVGVGIQSLVRWGFAGMVGGFLGYHAARQASGVLRVNALRHLGVGCLMLSICELSPHVLRAVTLFLFVNYFVCLYLGGVFWI